MKFYKEFNKKENRTFYRVRFQFGGVPYNLTGDSRKELNELVDEIKVQSRRKKLGFETTKLPFPFLSEIFQKYLPTIKNSKHQEFSLRVFNTFSSIIGQIRLDELKKAHFTIYANYRQKQKVVNQNVFVKNSTINKEMYAIRAALKSVPLFYVHLADYEPPIIPTQKVKQKSRTRQVDELNELSILLNELRQTQTRKGLSNLHLQSRHRLADELEFRFETGLRRNCQNCPGQTGECFFRWEGPPSCSSCIQFCPVW